MQFNHRNLSPLHCASTDATRHNLNSLHIAADGSTVAADGNVLAHVTPANDGIPVTVTPFTIDREALKALQSEQRKKKTPDADLDIEATNNNCHARICSAGITTEIPKMEATYPAWEQITNPRPGAHTVGISLHVLEQMVATARQFSATKKGEFCGLKFEFPEDEFAPIRASRMDDGDEIEILAMPCRVG